MATTDFIIRGEDILAQKPGFKLVGRAGALMRLGAILMQSKSNSVLLTGPGGVGCSALCYGLQASKDDPLTPFDIVSKRLFWLNSDALFSSGDSSAINVEFQRIMKVLSITPDSVLIIPDTKDFIDAARDSGCGHFVNALVQAIGSKRTQVILEAPDNHLDSVYKCHSGIQEDFTLMDLEEPDAESLSAIVTSAARDLEKFHRLKISDDAIATAIDTTNKYRAPRDPGLGYNRAQPDRAITLLDRALARYRFTSHQEPENIAKLKAQIAASTDASVTATLTETLRTTEIEWNRIQKQMRGYHNEQRDAEAEILKLEDELVVLKQKEDERRKASTETEDGKDVGTFSLMMSKSGYDSPESARIKARISTLQKAATENREAFYALANTIDIDLTLTPEIVQREFSRLSGIPLNKINEDERAKLKRLEDDLRGVIFGQDEAIHHIVNAIKTFKVGRRNKGAPLSLLFKGPSGVGKTEICRAISRFLFDSEEALLRFDMSEFMEKHAVARLIGAPPGYEGFEVGGILTNAMRQNDQRIILFDEIEKAHPDVFNVLLQVLGEAGRLTDNIGRVVRFGRAMVIATTNVGSEYFLQVVEGGEYTQQQACEDAMTDLEKFLRPELLNRFNGRENILGFKKLGLDTIQKIVRRELTSLDVAYAEQNIRVAATDEVLAQFCRDHYNPVIGARGLPAKIKTSIEPAIVNRILDLPQGAAVTMRVSYTVDTKSFSVAWETDNGQPAA